MFSFGVSSYECATILADRLSRDDIMPVTQANKNSRPFGPAFQEMRIIYTCYGLAGSVPINVSATFSGRVLLGVGRDDDTIVTKSSDSNAAYTSAIEIPEVA